MTNKNQMAELRSHVESAADCGFIHNVSIDGRLLASLLDQLEEAEALNSHLDLAVRKAEGVSEACRRRAEKAESSVIELKNSFDELAFIVGFSAERCAQTGESPMDCANSLIASSQDSARLAGRNAARAEKAEAELAKIKGDAVPVVSKDWLPENLDRALTILGVALPVSKEEFNFQVERWMQRLINKVIKFGGEIVTQPVPVVVRIPGYRPQDMDNGYSPNAFSWNSALQEVIIKLEEQGLSYIVDPDYLGPLLTQPVPVVVEDMDDLVMQIRRLAQALRMASHDNKLPGKVSDYMRRKGYFKNTDCLRAVKSADGEGE